MKRKTLIRSLAGAALGAALLVPIATYGQDGGSDDGGADQQQLVALTHAFTFQGSLADGGSPASGAYDFEFALYDALAAGAQVGSTQTVGDVAVAGGLFTVTLDFGDVFHGDQHFLEIRVRAGASGGAYTTLTPRQALWAAPNASFAIEAGSATGLQGIGVDNAAPLLGDVLRYNGTEWAPSAAAGGGGLSLPYTAAVSSGTPLITIQNTSPSGANAIALHGKISSTSSNAWAVIGEVTSTAPGGSSTGVRGINNGTGGNGIGVWGSQAGSGYGVFGFTPSGFGVYGSSTAGDGVYGDSSSGSAGHFSSTGGNALEVDGKIKVGGSQPAAFIWTVTAPSLGCGSDQCTDIDHPSTNGHPNAIVIVTHRWSGTYEDHPIGVNYIGGKWRIYNEDQEAISVGEIYHVLVIHP